MPEPHLLLDGLKFPEGPCFAPDGTLWWVEIEGGRIGCLAPEGPVFFEIGGRPNGAAFDRDGILWIADQGMNAIRRFDPAMGRASNFADRVDGGPLGKPNDLCFDRVGRLVFTCSNDARIEPIGYVCRMTADGHVEKIADGLMFPNGIAFSPDGALVIAETYRQRLISGAYDDDLGTWQSLASTPGPVGPDGMAFATDGSVFVANFGQGTVTRHSPDGALISTLALPGAKPTNVALDPSGAMGLVVTEVETGALYSIATSASPLLSTRGPSDV